MDGMTLLREARAAGLLVMVDGDQLRIRGPRRAEPIARQLIAHKVDVMMAMVSDLPADWHLLWDERAAIMEYDGGLPRERAEALALADIIQAMTKPK
jgi:hypothetical protein